MKTHKPNLVIMSDRSTENKTFIHMHTNRRILKDVFGNDAETSRFAVCKGNKGTLSNFILID